MRSTFPASRFDEATSRRPLEAVEVALRRFRVIAAAVLVGAATGLRDISVSVDRPTLIAIAAVLALTLVGANAVSIRSTRIEGAVRGVWIQLAGDTVVTIGTIWLFDPRPDSYGWVILGLPILEGAMRYRVLGAVSVWLAIAATLIMRLIIQWAPGDGLASFAFLGAPLAMALVVGLPAGYLSDHLVREVNLAAEDRERANHRARLLAVLAVANQDLATDDPAALCRTVVEASVELGFAWADIIAPDEPGQAWRSVASAGDSSVDPGRPTAELEQALVELVPGATVSMENGLAVAALGPIPVILRVVAKRKPTTFELQALQTLCVAAEQALRAAHRVIDLEDAKVRLRHDATHDPLTGLLNRAGLLAALDQRIALLGHGGPPIVVSLLDLNGFKEVNDAMGHDAGDEVLVVAGRRLVNHAPPGAVVARFGGDEFVVLFDRVPTIEPSSVTTRLRAALCEPVRISKGIVHVGTAIGCSIIDDPGSRPDQALRAADHAMYADKGSQRADRQGRDRLGAGGP